MVLVGDFIFVGSQVFDWVVNIVVFVVYFVGWDVYCQCQNLMAQVDVKQWFVFFQYGFGILNCIIYWCGVVRAVGYEVIIWLLFMDFFKGCFGWEDFYVVVVFCKVVEYVLFNVKVYYCNFVFCVWVFKGVNFFSVDFRSQFQFIYGRYFCQFLFQYFQVGGF